jgi:hypothetical protein
LDTNCKAHELDNLYVVDTSFFPSIGAVNPALTVMANALRVGIICWHGSNKGNPVAERNEVVAVYSAGVIQGVALVTPGQRFSR